MNRYKHSGKTTRVWEIHNSDNGDPCSFLGGDWGLCKDFNKLGLFKDFKWSPDVFNVFTDY